MKNFLKNFLKINIVSFLLGLFFFIFATFNINIYRINRLSNIDIHILKLIFKFIYILIIILIPYLLYRIIKSYLNLRNLNYLLSFLWFPYFFIMFNLFSTFFPIINPQEMPTPGDGLYIMGSSVFYCIYLFIIIYYLNNKFNS